MTGCAVKKGGFEAAFLFVRAQAPELCLTVIP